MATESFDIEKGVEILNANKKFLRGDKYQELFDTLTAEERRDVFNTCLEFDINPINYMTSIPDNMFDGWGHGVLILPQNIDSVGQNAFRGSKFTKIKLPEGIRQIPRGCFESCKASQIFIPSSCKSFAPGAFKDYEGLILLPKKGNSRYDNVSFPKNETEYYKEHIRRVKSSEAGVM